MTVRRPGMGARGLTSPRTDQRDVLDLSKIEAGQLVLELADYTIQDIAQTVRGTRLSRWRPTRSSRLSSTLVPSYRLAMVTAVA